MRPESGTTGTQGRLHRTYATHLQRQSHRAYVLSPPRSNKAVHLPPLPQCHPSTVARNQQPNSNAPPSQHPPGIPGTFSLEGALVCSLCPSGFYSGVRASECIPCAIGTYRQIDSASGGCDPCAAGTYAPFEQASVCLDCPRGFYSEAGGAASCSPCPAGTAGGSIAGGALADACVDCTAGEYSTVDGSTACEQCLAGTASLTVGADNDDVCEVRRVEGGRWWVLCELRLGRVRCKSYVGGGIRPMRFDTDTWRYRDKVNDIGIG